MVQKFTPTPLIIRSSLDEIGSLIDIDRIPEEAPTSYLKRIFDTYANRASSTYEGLLNGINRELGVVKKDCIKIHIRDIGYLENNTNITLTATTITDNNTYANTIDGVNVIASGTELTDSTMSWEPSTLRGYKLKILTDSYEVVDNTVNSITIKEDLDSLVGQTYSVEPDYEEGELIGLGVRIGNVLLRISENTSNVIRIDGGDLLSHGSGYLRITSFNPRVEVTGSKIYLYKEYANQDNFQLEKSLDLRTDARLHKNIVEEVNKLKFFHAENLLDRREEIISYTLKRQSSSNEVISELVPSMRFFKLANSPVKDGSARFTEVDTFLSEVSLDQVSQGRGNYSIDYDNGVVTAKSLPTGAGTVSYAWNDFPFTIQHSPVVINAFRREDSQEFLFFQAEVERYNNEKEHFVSSQPKADMIEFIAELLSVSAQNWGE